VVEFFAVVFAADQLGGQVVGQRAAPASDHVLEVVAEGLKGVEDAGLVGGEISSQRSSSNQRPSACEMEVIAGQARSCWSDRTDWTSKRLLSQWFRD
jgi:hypothetical protein